MNGGLTVPMFRSADSGFIHNPDSDFGQVGCGGRGRGGVDDEAAMLFEFCE